MSHKHLTASERENILVAKTEGKSITMIAEIIGRNKSTVSRELKRNSDGHKYSPSKAQNNYEHRRLDCKRQLVLEDNDISSVVQESLGKGWSPEQIVGRLDLAISVPTIYRGIKNGALPPQFKECLRRKGKPYKYKRNGEETRGKLVGCKSIELRPVEVEKRVRIGDWEGDTVLGSPGTGGIVTLVDRMSRFIVAHKIDDKRAETTTERILEGLAGLPCRSITLDNGKEFAEHKKIEEWLKTEVFFAHPHSPWERGTNENTNGLVREYLPKGSDFREYGDDEVQVVVKRLNDRPRKVIGYETPAEAFLQNIVAFDLTI